MEGHKTPRVFVYRDYRDAVCSAAAGRDVIEAFGSMDAFESYFGGYLVFGWPPSAGHYLGVWGNRNCSRFRRILRARLGLIEVAHREPTKPLVLVSTSGKRLNRVARQRAERKMGL